jgi:hypothetical protein
MDAGLSPARQARAKHRHELRTLTYVTLDEANGGIVRNLSDRGIAVQTVAAVRPHQQLRVNFELNRPRANHSQPKHPQSNYSQSNYSQSNHARLRVEGRGEVMWATPSGQCGISFVDLPPRMTRQINEWIFGDLLEGIALHSERTGSLFAASSFGSALPVYEDDGLMISPAPLKVIALPLRADPLQAAAHGLDADAATALVPLSELDWLSQPLSGHSLIWTINTLVALAALLLFVLVFLSVTREAPRWPLAMMGGAAMFVAALYWGFFQLFGGSSPGARLARLLGSDAEEDVEASDDRFR